MIANFGPDNPVKLRQGFAIEVAVDREARVVVTVLEARRRVGRERVDEGRPARDRLLLEACELVDADLLWRSTCGRDDSRHDRAHGVQELGLPVLDESLDEAVPFLSCPGLLAAGAGAADVDAVGH